MDESQAEAQAQYAEMLRKAAAKKLKEEQQKGKNVVEALKEARKRQAPLESSQ